METSRLLDSRRLEDNLHLHSSNVGVDFTKITNVAMVGSNNEFDSVGDVIETA